MRRVASILIGVCLLIPPPSAWAGALPRFASFKSEETNLRAGPGTEYPIKWVYRRTYFPVEIIDEYGHWRKVRDVDGEQGWVHKGLLSGARAAVVTGSVRTFRHKPDAMSRPVFKAEPMVIGKLLECVKDWCQMQVSGHKGWIKKSEIWGAYKKEEFED